MDRTGASVRFFFATLDRTGASVRIRLQVVAMTQHEIANPEPSDRAEAILEQALRTFAELGFRATDVQLIADRAGVGKGTVYRHFGAKEDLFWATAFEVFKRLRHALTEAEQAVSGGAPKLRAACLAYGRFFDEHPDYLEVFVQDRAEFRGSGPEAYKQDHEALLQRFVGIVERGIAAGEFRPVDPHATMIALSGLLYGIAVQGCYLSHGGPIRAVIEQGINAFLAGMEPGAGAHRVAADDNSLTDPAAAPPHPGTPS